MGFTEETEGNESFAGRNPIFHYCNVFGRRAMIEQIWRRALPRRAVRQARATDRTVAKDALTYEDLLKIVELVKSSPQFSEFRLKVGEIELHLRRKREGGVAGAAEVASAERTADPEARPVAHGGDRAATWPEHWSVVR